MKRTIWMIYAASLLLGACSRLPEIRPDDFRLQLDWNTGALPPKYHYSYSLEIGPQPKGEVVYQYGYSPEENPDPWTADFSLSPTEMDALFNLLSEKDILRSDWTTGQPLLGGKSTSLIIVASGKTYSVPSISELNSTDRKIVETVIDEIRGFVPQSIWDEMAALQKENEANFED